MKVLDRISSMLLEGVARDAVDRVMRRNRVVFCVIIAADGGVAGGMAHAWRAIDAKHRKAFAEVLRKEAYELEQATDADFTSSSGAGGGG